MIKHLLLAAALACLPVGAQAQYAQQLGSSSSIISGGTPCTGCAAGGVLINNGGVVTGNAVITYSGTNLALAPAGYVTVNNGGGGVAFSINNITFPFAEMASNGAYAFSANGSGTSTIDTTICRSAAGLVEIGASTGCAGTGAIMAASFQPGIHYSAAGIPLPACGAGLDGTSAVVSDSTSSPVYRNPYASGGTVTAKVFCVNGTGWIND